MTEPPIGRIISSTADLQEGLAWLGQRDSYLAQAIEVSGEIPLRQADQGFAALLGAILSQQVSVASARAIRNRVEAAGFMDPEALRQAHDDDLRACGLSRPKMRYARALAEARVDFAALALMPDEKVIAHLVEIPGIGRWTAEIYAMFALGRADVFAANDLALQEAVRLLCAMEHRPGERELRAMAEAWRPWRAVAARLLWAYYKVAKDREGIA